MLSSVVSLSSSTQNVVGSRPLTDLLLSVNTMFGLSCKDPNTMFGLSCKDPNTGSTGIGSQSPCTLVWTSTWTTDLSKNLLPSVF